MVGKLLQSLELGDASNLRFRPVPPIPLAGRKPATRLAAPEVCPGAVWSSLDREMALQFSRIAPAAAQTSGFCHLGNASVQVSDRGLDRRYSNAVA